MRILVCRVQNNTLNVFVHTHKTHIWCIFCSYTHTCIITHKGVRPVLSLKSRILSFIFFFFVQFSHFINYYYIVTWRLSDNCFTSITYHYTYYTHYNTHVRTRAGRVLPSILLLLLSLPSSSCYVRTGRHHRRCSRYYRRHRNALLYTAGTLCSDRRTYDGVTYTATGCRVPIGRRSVTPSEPEPFSSFHVALRTKRTRP